MTWEVWVLGIALVCIIEGILPFAAPEKWLAAVREIGKSADPLTVRKIGLTLVCLGVSAIWLLTL